MNDTQTEMTDSTYYKVDVDDIMNQSNGYANNNNGDKFDNILNQRISRFEGVDARYKFNIK